MGKVPLYVRFYEVKLSVARDHHHPTPESQKGSPKVNIPSRHWFSKVESANIGAFE